MPQPNNAGAKTVGEYLIELLKLLWEERDGFDGKRPFGNSGWEYDLYVPLVKAGMIDGKLDGDDFLDECDNAKGDRLINLAILALAGWKS